MKKRYFGMVCTAILLLIAAVTVFAVEREQEPVVTNTGRLGIVRIGLEQSGTDDGKEILPGQTVPILSKIKNEGADCYIRSKVQVQIRGKEEFSKNEELPADHAGKDLSGNWIKAGDYYYYTKPLMRNEEAVLSEAFLFPQTVGNEWAGSDLTVSVLAEAVQSEFFQPDFEHDTPWGLLTAEASLECEYDPETVFKNEGSRENEIRYEGGAKNFVTPCDDFFARFSAMMPGGSYTGTAQILNRSDKETELFFKTGTEEDGGLPEGVTLSIGCSSQEQPERLLYEGPFSGDRIRDYLSCGVYKPGESCTLRYTVSVPEDLKNDAALSSGRNQWYFLAKETPDETSIQNESPKTGDNIRGLILFLISGILSGCVIITVLFRQLKRHGRHEKE